MLGKNVLTKMYMSKNCLFTRAFGSILKRLCQIICHNIWQDNP